MITRTLRETIGPRYLILFFGLLAFGCETELKAPETLSLEAQSALDVLPPDAPLVAKADLQALHRNTLVDPFSEEHLMIDRLDAEIGARIQAFLDATGFDPQKDLREVYLAVEDRASPHSAASIVVYADYDQGRLVDYFDQRLSGDFARTDYQGAFVYHNTRGDESLYFSPANDDMIVLSNSERHLHAMLDRLDGSGARMADNGALMQLVGKVNSGSIWAVVRGVNAGREGMDAPGAGLANALQDVALAVNVSSTGLNVDAYIRPKQGVSTEDVADVTRGLVATMKARPNLDPATRSTLDHVKVQTSGDVAHVSVSVENATLSALR